MPRPALTDEQRREMRHRIRKAASDLYAENGLTEISARAIANRAEVSVGTIYSHFENLTELMQSLWRAPVKRLLDELKDVAATHPEPLDALRVTLQIYERFAREQPTLYRGAFMYVRPESHQKPRQASVEQSDITGPMLAAISLGQRQGVIREGDPSRLAELLWAGLHGAIGLPVNIDRVAFSPPEELDRNMIELLLEWIAR
jgi:AcrR family transcriptional regulator